ncbi:MAG: PorT family protein [Bacteroidales bacterium]|nr:PorT family protein [Bacteroidales bacterium]
MRKFIIAMMAMAMCVGMQAQVRTSRTFTKSKGGAFEWVVRAGLSINNLSGIESWDESDEISNSAKTSFEVDFGFNKSFKNSNLYWGMELGIGTRGVKLEDDNSDWSESLSTYNVKFTPFLIGYKIPVGEDMKVDPHLGVWALYDFAIDDLDINQRYDVGLQAGVGFWYKFINLDLSYQFGFINSEPYTNGRPWYDFSGGKTSNLLIRLGISF